MSYNTSIINSIYENSTIIGHNSLSRIDNYRNELNVFLEHLVDHSMFPVVDSFRLRDSKMDFLKVTTVHSKEFDKLTPFDIAKSYNTNNNIEKRLNLISVKKDFFLVKKSLPIETRLKQTFCNILNFLDSEFEQLLDKHGEIVENKNNLPIFNYIVSNCGIIGQRTRRGAGNHILINKLIYEVIKPFITQHDETSNLSDRNIVYVGKLSISIDVYINNSAPEDYPIYVWYASNTNSMDVPLLLVQGDIISDTFQSLNIANCFLDNDINQNFLTTSNYICKLNWR